MAGRVAIIGVGMVPSGTQIAPSWELFSMAALEAIRDAEIELSEMEGLHLGNVYSAFTETQTNLSPKVLSSIGIASHIPCIRYETACASGSVALRQGYLNILSGEYRLLLVGGTERLRAVPGGLVQQAMATSMDMLERNNGLTFAAYWAFVAKAYARKHGLREEELEDLLAKISIKNHYHGASNKFAHFQKEVSMEEVMGSSPVAPPIKIMDCCPFSDGAAALVLASEDVAKACPCPIWIVGSGQASGNFAISDCSDFAINPAILSAASDAYTQAGVQAKDIGVAEVHDCVNIHEVICLEGAGLFREGEGIYSAAEGRTYVDGDIPTNLSGGLKSRGHPVGATGAYQLCEITQQLRGDFGGKIAKNPSFGMTVNVGGTGTVVTVHILGRE